MNKTTRALLISTVLLALPAWANHHHTSGSGSHSSGDVGSPTPEVCVEWRLDDGGVTDAGADEVERDDDGGVVIDVLPCAKTEPLGCSSTTGTAMIGLAALVGGLRRRR